MRRRRLSERHFWLMARQLSQKVRVVIPYEYMWYREVIELSWILAFLRALFFSLSRSLKRLQIEGLAKRLGIAVWNDLRDILISGRKNYPAAINRAAGRAIDIKAITKSRFIRSWSVFLLPEFAISSEFQFWNFRKPGIVIFDFLPIQKMNGFLLSFFPPGRHAKHWPTYGVLSLPPALSSPFSISVRIVLITGFTRS